jgi:hypothetical protein
VALIPPSDNSTSLLNAFERRQTTSIYGDTSSTTSGGAAAASSDIIGTSMGIAGGHSGALLRDFLNKSRITSGRPRMIPGKLNLLTHVYYRQSIIRYAGYQQ